MDYQVNLPTFRGPLDLLLYLVKRNEVEIVDIPIATVAEQFRAYLDLIILVDVEAVGDFLVMAATLMEIKSRLLLPRAEVESVEEADPRRQLVQQLLEYKRFKDAAQHLEAHADRQQRLYARHPPPKPATVNETPLRPVELWDLVSAFGRLMRETLSLQPRQIVADETPLRVHMDQIRQRLRTQPRIEFAELFTQPRHRARLVGLFLAILELIKAREIVVEQEEFGTIWVTAVPVTVATAEPPTG